VEGGSDLAQGARLQPQLVALIADYLERDPGCDIANPLLAATLVQQTLVNASHQFVTAPPEGASQEDCARELTRMLTAYLGLPPESECARPVS